MVASVDDIAASVFAQAGPMASMKLQKLLYYVQSWSLVRNGHPAFDDPIEAWSQGPVVERIYRSHRGRRRIVVWTQGDADALDSDLDSVVHDVVTRYGTLSGDELSDLAHREQPWLDARAGSTERQRSRQIISTDAMKDFYRRRSGTPAEAVKHAMASSALEGVELGEDFSTRLLDMVEGRVSMRELID